MVEVSSAVARNGRVDDAESDDGTHQRLCHCISCPQLNKIGTKCAQVNATADGFVSACRSVAGKAQPFLERRFAKCFLALAFAWLLRNTGIFPRAG
jgi:hypothetical protein